MADVPNHGPCGWCGKDVIHACPWLRDMPDGGKAPLHPECAREVLFGAGEMLTGWGRPVDMSGLYPLEADEPITVGGP